MFTPLTKKEEKNYFKSYYLQTVVNKKQKTGLFLLVDSTRAFKNDLYNAIVIAEYNTMHEKRSFRIENLRLTSSNINKKYYNELFRKMISIIKSNYLLSDFLSLEISTTNTYIKLELAKQFILYKKYGSSTKITGLLIVSKK